jgi:hypothetical protein
MFTGLVALLPAACALAQPLGGEVPPFEQRLPPQPLQAQPLRPGAWQPSGEPLAGEAPATDDPGEVWATDEVGEVDLLVETPQVQPLDAFLGYRYEASSLDWIIGGGDQFGVFSINGDHYQHSGVQSGAGVGLGIHFLAGPERTDMPPRVFDFSIAYQHRQRLGWLGYDVAASVTASSDFEGSAREGIRFPSHAVGFLDLGPRAELVFGVDYLDRGDVKLLPVGGLIVFPHPAARFEIVFPRPRAVFQLTDDYRLYVAGELGGGTWAVERFATVDDLATYRDLRVGVGLQRAKGDGPRTALEVSYLFDRRLEFASGVGDYRPDDTAMIRLITTF